MPRTHHKPEEIVAKLRQETAKMLSIAVPTTLLVRADAVIE